jgi:endonuclease/exonuclease/phosphatase family metal-dependent hydrolase
MKLITLNIWGGRQWNPFVDFLKKYSDVDIFLFQEVHNNATPLTKWQDNVNEHSYSHIIQILPGHNSYHAPSILEEWGLATFVKNSIVVETHGNVFVFRTKDAYIHADAATIPKNIHHITFDLDGRKTTIINFHGLWNGKGKTDTEDRIKQSQKVIDFIKGIEGDVILSGDFNLRPDTESLKMIERELNLKNLISEHGITSTRTSFYTKDEKFADYILTSPTVQVKDFRVLPEEVSDHAALYLEF